MVQLYCFHNGVIFQSAYQCYVKLKLIYRQDTVVVNTDLQGKELHRQVGVGIVMISGKPKLCNGSTPAWNARDAGSVPTLGTIFPIFITPTTVHC